MTLLTEAKYEDRCARCLKPCTRVRATLGLIVCTVCLKPCDVKAHRGMNNHWRAVSVCCEAPTERERPSRWVTSCCGAKAIAVRVE